MKLESDWRTGLNLSRSKIKNLNYQKVLGRREWLWVTGGAWTWQSLQKEAGLHLSMVPGPTCWPARKRACCETI
jgi:hypothetical protein